MANTSRIVERGVWRTPIKMIGVGLLLLLLPVVGMFFIGKFVRITIIPALFAFGFALFGESDGTFHCENCKAKLTSKSVEKCPSCSATFPSIK